LPGDTQISGFNNGGTNALLSAVQYLNIAFVFLVAVAWIFALFGDNYPQGKLILGALFFGLFFFVHILGNTTWETVDDLRYANKHKLKYTSAIFLFLIKDVKILLAGAILNYIGTYLAVLVVAGNFKLKLNLATILLLVAIAFQVIGCIILWTLPAMAHSGDNAGNDDATASVQQDLSSKTRTAVFDEITVPQIAILLMLGASVFFDRAEGAICGALFIGLYGLWYLSQGFYLKYYIYYQGASQNFGQTGVDKSWAGALFCWFSALTSIVVAWLAAAANDNGAVTPV